MTEQEAIGKLNMLDEALNFQRHDAVECSLALNMATEALEKQIPKKPIIKTNAYNRKFYECPNCRIDIADVIFSPYMYCHKCGQKIDKEVSE